MARPKKESKPFNIRMSAELYKRLEDYCEEVGQTKTTAVERILTEALDRFEKDKSISSNHTGKE